MSTKIEIPQLEKKPTTSVVSASDLVDSLFDDCIPVVKDLIEDALESGFDSIPPNAWYNALSSIAAIVMRVKALRGDEKKQERVVYLLLEKLLCDESIVQIDHKSRGKMLAMYAMVAPPIIDLLIPSSYTECCSCFPCFAKKKNIV